MKSEIQNEGPGLFIPIRKKRNMCTPDFPFQRILGGRSQRPIVPVKINYGEASALRRLRYRFPCSIPSDR